tara:strand:- start:8342 stop:8647 length:306 start_codon:yes stop_codon:yes gene_type:complete
MTDAFDPNDPTFQWIKAIHRDLTNLRDNHLAHVDSDLASLKADMQIQRYDIDAIRTDMKEVMPIIRELQFFNSRIGRKIILAAILMLGAWVGIPMAGIETL